MQVEGLTYIIWLFSWANITKCDWLPQDLQVSIPPPEKTNYGKRIYFHEVLILSKLLRNPSQRNKLSLDYIKGMEWDR